MLQPRMHRCVVTALEPNLTSLAIALNRLSLCRKHQATPSPKIQLRHASHASQGRANGPKDSAGRRLGAKKSASEYVVPGNIIFKQRGTKWHPGENVDMGKDHTIYATQEGYVRYYKNPDLHPKRRYIGVALEREGPRSVLPTPRNAVSRRRLGMVAAPIKDQTTDSKAFLEAHLSANSHAAAPSTSSKPAAPAPIPVILKEGTFHESNYSIGRAAERKGVVVRAYDRRDRWKAWHKRRYKVQQGRLARAAKANRKTKGKKVNKGQAGGPGRKR